MIRRLFFCRREYGYSKRQLVVMKITGWRFSIARNARMDAHRMRTFPLP